MKKLYLLSLVCLAMFAMSAVVLLAQTTVDDRGNPNDPATNPRANVCYTGGSLAGKCDEEWKWVCGWGIARVEKGIFNRAVLSAECQNLMPALEPTYTPPAKESKGAGNDSIFPTTTPMPK